jgi:AraC family transcriptional regulator, activator of mtrCDE
MQKQHGQPTSGYEYAPVGFDKAFPFRADTHMRYVDDSAYTLPHLHNCLEIGCCHSGSGVFMIGEKVRTFAEGDCVVINDREPHYALNNHEDVSEWSWLYIDPAGMLSGLLSVMPHLLPLVDYSSFCGARFENILSIRNRPLECRLINYMVDEMVGGRRYSRDAVRHCLLLLLIHLHRAIDQRIGSARPTTSMVSVAAPHIDILGRLEPAMRFIATHYSEQIAVTRLASLCSTSVGNFRKMFHEAFGCSPKRYVTNMRVARACLELKSTQSPIAMIALRNGFPDVSCFNREFKRQFGESPREWRKASR